MSLYNVDHSGNFGPVVQLGRRTSLKMSKLKYFVASFRTGMSDEVPLARDVNRIEGS